jgi:hypothetical protein
MSKWCAPCRLKLQSLWQAATCSVLCVGGRQEVSSNSTTRRMSTADTPSHGREPPPLLRSYNLRCHMYEASLELLCWQNLLRSPTGLHATHLSRAVPASTLRRRMGDAPLVRLAVHQQPEGLLQRGALLACTLDFQAGRDAAATGAAPRCTDVGCMLHSFAALCCGDASIVACPSVLSV